MINIISIHNPSKKLSTTISSDPGRFQISFKMNDWKYFVPFYWITLLLYYLYVYLYILTNFLPVRLNCLKIRTDQLQFSMNSALTIRMLLLLKSIWCISSIFCSVYLNYIEWNIFSLQTFLKNFSCQAGAAGGAMAGTMATDGHR